MKNIFITGASRGIGAAISNAAIRDGHRVWGTSRDPKKLTPSEQFHPVFMDLRDSNSIETAFATAHSGAGRIDVLINNAGAGHFGPAELLSRETLESQFQTLVFAHIKLMQLAIFGMRSQGGGLVINITSLAARLPIPFMAAYNAAKAAMASFTMSMQLELADSRVKIVDVEPADISTSFNNEINIDNLQSDYKTVLERTWRIVTANMARAPKPELVAEQVLRLIDDPDPPPRLTVGDLFQSKLAPFIFRFLPQRLGIWGLKKYYRL